MVLPTLQGQAMMMATTSHTLISMLVHTLLQLQFPMWQELQGQRKALQYQVICVCTFSSYQPVYSDPLLSVTISGPRKFPAYTRATFSCDVQSQSGTQYYTPVTYQWTFADSFSTTGASVSHQFNHPGRVTVTCTASNPISVKANQTQLLIADCKYYS